jgi:DNA-binding winged helix-turn-helix (wHTH) protein
MNTVPIAHRDDVGSPSNAGDVLPHQALLDRVWGDDCDANPEYLRTFVSRLRAKLRHGGGTAYIETEGGHGYRFVRLRELVAADAGLETEPVSTPVGGLRT